MKFGLYTERKKSRYVFFEICNHVLYNTEYLHKILELPATLNLQFNNFTAIDLAWDNFVNYPSLIKKLMRNKSIETILNGRVVSDRKKLLHEIIFGYGTTLDTLKHLSITIKQQIERKDKGVVIQAYNKKAEILNSSGKQYILDFYCNPRRLYRLEVRLPYQNLYDYFKKKKKSFTVDENLIFNQQVLSDMFFAHLFSVIRFRKGRKVFDWKELIADNGRV